MEKKLTKKAQDKKAEASVIAEECFANSRTVKAFAMEKNEQEKYSKVNTVVYHIGALRAFIFGIFNFFLTAFLYGSIIVVIWYGSRLNRDDEISIGMITSYLFFCIQILVNFSILGNLIGTLMQVSGASQKIIEFIDHVPLIKSRGGLKPESQFGDIEFKDVKFSYPSKKNVQILNGITLSIKKN